MKLLALISGGKDSIYSILCARRLGHEVVLLGHMIPRNSNTHELDSYMFQIIGHNTIKSISECLEIPLVERIISGFSSTQSLTYIPNSLDEVEDLYYLVEDALGFCRELYAQDINWKELKTCKKKYKCNYRRCSRLKLKSISPLWDRDQGELLADMIKDQMEAILVKTCSLGLYENHLGKTISELYEVFIKMRDKFGFNVCGEGGEYESLVLDCTMYKKRIVIEEHERIYHSKDPYAPTILFVPTKWRLESKE